LEIPKTPELLGAFISRFHDFMLDSNTEEIMHLVEECVKVVRDKIFHVYVSQALAFGATLVLACAITIWMWQSGATPRSPNPQGGFASSSRIDGLVTRRSNRRLPLRLLRREREPGIRSDEDETNPDRRAILAIAQER
jgi:hypothetical protein